MPDREAFETGDYLGMALNAKVDDVLCSVKTGVKCVDVSIVAANYNNVRFLAAFLWSILNGTVLPKEIIVVDDGSRDGSAEILAAMEKRVPCLRVIYFNVNKGFAHALNEAIAYATGRYVARIDPDDICGFDRIERQYNELEKGECHVIGSNAVIFDSDSGRIITHTNFPVTVRSISDRIRKGEHGLLHPTVMAQTSLFKQYSYRQENVPAEDYDIFARMLRDGAIIGNIADCLMFYRVHGSSASTNMKYSLIQKTFDLRDEIFAVRTSSLRRIRYFVFIYSYRSYLYNKNRYARYFWGGVASFAAPLRLLSRLVK